MKQRLGLIELSLAALLATGCGSLNRVVAVTDTLDAGDLTFTSAALRDVLSPSSRLRPSPPMRKRRRLGRLC